MSLPERPPILLLYPDTEYRRTFAAALRAVGFEVSTARHIAEIERWPVGTVVVVDAPRFTPWWQTVGAAHVVVLSDSTDARSHACPDMPSNRVPRQSGPEALISILLFTTRHHLPLTTNKP